MEENKQNVQDGGKVKKKFEESLRRLQAILGSPDWYKRSKIGQAELPALLERMTATKKEDLYRKFETMASNLIEKKLAYDKEVKQKEQEFNKIVEEKMKSFQVEMDEMFAIIDQIDNITKDYFGALNSIAEGTPPVVIGNTQPGEGIEGNSSSL